jgi:hypothetical protein
MADNEGDRRRIEQVSYYYCKNDAVDILRSPNPAYVEPSIPNRDRMPPNRRVVTR